MIYKLIYYIEKLLSRLEWYCWLVFGIILIILLVLLNENHWVILLFVNGELMKMKERLKIRMTLIVLEVIGFLFS